MHWTGFSAFKCWTKIGIEDQIPSEIIRWETQKKTPCEEAYSPGKFHFWVDDFQSQLLLKKSKEKVLTRFDRWKTCEFFLLDGKILIVWSFDGWFTPNSSQVVSFFQRPENLRGSSAGRQWFCQGLRTKSENQVEMKTSNKSTPFEQAGTTWSWRFLHIFLL